MDVLDAIKARRSIRKYSAQPIPEDVLRDILNAARCAPSAKNIQPWRFIIVRDEEVKRKLAIACNNQKFVAEAPVVIVGCGLVDEAYGTMGGYMSSYIVDVTIALDHLILAATSKGLGTCWIGSFNEEKVKALLQIPPDVRVIALTPIGYPDEKPPPKNRKNLSELVCYDRYK